MPYVCKVLIQAREKLKCNCLENEMLLNKGGYGSIGKERYKCT